MGFICVNVSGDCKNRWIKVGIIIAMFFTGLLLFELVIVNMGAPTLFYKDTENEVISYNFPFVTREQWHARPAKQITPLASPVPFVVIHHSYTPPACNDTIQCRQSMRSMQNFHMDDRGWWDIGYNFAVGGDGFAYQGRGWGVLGAHSLHFNTVSIGICLIGDWSDKLPPSQQMKTAQALIAAGVEMGYISPHYKLVGHRQVRNTECPGTALFEEIQRWDHYSPFPSSAKDLPNVPELTALTKH